MKHLGGARGREHEVRFEREAGRQLYFLVSNLSWERWIHRFGKYAWQWQNDPVMWTSNQENAFPTPVLSFRSSVRDWRDGEREQSLEGYLDQARLTPSVYCRVCRHWSPSTTAGMVARRNGMLVGPLRRKVHGRTRRKCAFVVGENRLWTCRRTRCNPFRYANECVPACLPACLRWLVQEAVLVGRCSLPNPLPGLVTLVVCARNVNARYCYFYSSPPLKRYSLGCRTRNSNNTNKCRCLV